MNICNHKWTRTVKYSTNAVFRLKSSKIHSRAHWLCKLVEAFLARVLITWYSQSTSFAAFDSIHYNKNTHMVMTLSGVGGILGCSLFMTGTWKIFFAKIKHFCTFVALIVFLSYCFGGGEIFAPAQQWSQTALPDWRGWRGDLLRARCWCTRGTPEEGKLDLFWGITLLTSSLMSWSVKRKVVPVPGGAVLRLQGRNNEVSSTCHSSCAEQILQVLQKVGGVVSPLRKK